MTVTPLGSCAHVPGGGGGGGGGGSTVTVMAAVPFCPSLVAVIVAEPTRRPVTNPLPLTVATSVLLLPHVTVRPVSTLPLASRNVAVSCCVPATAMLAVDGLTVTVATGAVLAEVVALTRFDNAPNTASTLSVPRKATNSNW